MLIQIIEGGDEQGNKILKDFIGFQLVIINILTWDLASCEVQVERGWIREKG